MEKRRATRTATRVALLLDRQDDGARLGKMDAKRQPMTSPPSLTQRLPCVFVRLAVCDARCSWCDTPHAVTQGSAWTVEAVLERVQSYGCPLVEVTGGEPLLQAEVLPLMTRLADLGLTVLLETSGAH